MHRRVNMETPAFSGERFIPDICARTSLYLEHMARYRCAMQFARGKRVLDAATGAGYGASLLRQAGAASVLGVDLDTEAIGYAQRRHGADGVRFVVGDATRLDMVADASIDLFVCFETIEHVPDASAILRQAARVLAPGGLFVCSTPNYEVSRNRNPFHVREFHYGEFRELLSAHFPHTEVFVQRTRIANYLLAVDPTTGAVVAPESAGLDVARCAAAEDIAASPFFVAFAAKEAFAMPRGVLLLGDAADTERKNQHIQILEGGVAERDQSIAGLEAAARVRDGELAALRAEVGALQRAVGELQQRLAAAHKPSLAWRFVCMVAAADRRVGAPLSRVYRRLRALRSGAKAALAPTDDGAADGSIAYSIVIPVYEHERYLEECIESALCQAHDDFEVLIYDDASPSPGVRSVLAKFAGRTRARVYHGERNLGISAATNAAIALSRGRRIALLDCDDVLAPDALVKVDAFLRQRPEVDFVYTNRIDIDAEGAEVARLDFSSRARGSTPDELLVGMFTSHLKVIRRTAFVDSGLFRRDFDAVQDYELALRHSERHVFGLVPEPLYRHRVHRAQTTQQRDEHAAALARKAKDMAILRRRLLAGRTDKKTSIVVLSLNRSEDTIRCLDAIAAHTPLPHEVLLIDNGSQPTELERLRAAVRGRRGVTLHEEGRNHGVGGGRNLGASRATGDYLVFLDNDIVVSEGWLAYLITELESDPALAACCCRVVFPDGKLQFLGGGVARTAEGIRFVLHGGGLAADRVESMDVKPCDWIPGGATAYRASVFKEFPYDLGFAGAFEDNDWCMAVVKAGYRVACAPQAKVLHNHMNYSPQAQQDRHYTSQRYDREKLRKAVTRFWEKHGLLIDDPDIYRLLGFDGIAAFRATLETASGGARRA